ncbi:MAG: hypothetical protein AB8B39_04930 [Prochlorococcus sp.]
MTGAWIVDDILTNEGYSPSSPDNIRNFRGACWSGVIPGENNAESASWDWSASHGDLRFTSRESDAPG